MARVPYLDKKDLAPEFQSLLDRPINLNRAMVNAPAARRALAQVGDHIRNRAKLDQRLRELAILQVGYLARAPYEWSHHIKFGYEYGVSEDDIRGLIAVSEGGSADFDELTATVLRAARELTLDLVITDATFATLARHLDNELLVELVVVISYYNAVVRMLAALHIDVEPEYEIYLKQFPLPQ